MKYAYQNFDVIHESIVFINQIKNEFKHFGLKDYSLLCKKNRGTKNVVLHYRNVILIGMI